VDRGDFVDPVAEARLFQRVAVQLANIRRDLLALGVVPRAISDAIASVHCWLPVRRLRAEVGMPCAAAASDGCRQHLAVEVRSGQSAEVRAFAASRAGDAAAYLLR